MTDIFQEYIEEMKQKLCGATRKCNKKQLYEVLQLRIEEYIGRLLNSALKATGVRRINGYNLIISRSDNLNRNHIYLIFLS